MKAKSIKKTLCYAAISLGLPVIGVGANIDSLPFVDSFENGNLANSDTVADAWPNQNTGGYFTESGGRLNISIPSGAGSQFRLIQTDVSTGFDFYAQQVTFAAKDVSFVENGTPDNFLAMRLESDGTDDFIWIRFRSDGVVNVIERKNGGSNNSLFTDGTWSGTLTSFALTVNGSDVTAVWNSSGGGEGSFAGSTTISAAEWNGSGAALEIEGQSAVATPIFDTVASIGQIEVSASARSLSLFAISTP